MQVRHLSYFVTLAREQHFARAAAACCVAQPTLSAAIRKLENDLDIPLVVRGHRYLRLTQEGMRVLAWAQQIVTDYESLRAGLRSGLTGILRIGVVPAAMPSVSLLTSAAPAAWTPRTPKAAAAAASSSPAAAAPAAAAPEHCPVDRGLCPDRGRPLQRVSEALRAAKLGHSY